MQYHESVERGDAVIATYIGCRGVCAGDCEAKCDRGVCGGDLVVAVKVTFQWRVANPWVHKRESVDAGAARDGVGVVADAVAVGVDAGVVRVVVARGAGVPLVGSIVVGVVAGVVDQIIICKRVAARIPQFDAGVVVRAAVVRKRVVVARIG